MAIPNQIMVVPHKKEAYGALPVDHSAGTSTYVPGVGRSARISDAGVAAAGAAAQQAAASLGNIGKALGRFSELALQIKEKNDQIDIAKAQGAFAELQMEGIEEKTRLSKLRGGEAIGADGQPDVEAQWRSWFEKAKARYMKGLGGRGRWYFNQHAGMYGSTGAAWASQHVQNELGRYQDTQLKLAIEAEGQAMAADPSGASWSQHLGRLHALNEQRARHLGYSAEMLEELNRATDGKAIAAAIGVPMAMGDLQTAQALVGQYGNALTPEQYAQVVGNYNTQVRSQAAAAAAAGDIDGLEALANLGGGPGRGLHGAPTYTGKARVLAFRESGMAGSMHVSYGLFKTDGAADFGKYSFITKNGKHGGGGSGGEFFRWCGRKKDNPTAQLLYNTFNELVGGNWSNLDNRGLWKSRAEAAWKNCVKSNPRAVEELEDEFQLGRMNATIKNSLRPEVQKAILDDKTGAVYETVISTLNQHRQAVSILNSCWSSGNSIEEYLKKVYWKRSDPDRFKDTPDRMMGRKRFFGRDGRGGEFADVMAIYHGKASQNSLPQTPETAARLEAARMPTAAASLYSRIAGDGGTPEEQKERFWKATEDMNPFVRDKLRHVVEPWYRDGIKQSETDRLAADARFAQEFLPKLLAMKPENRRKAMGQLKLSGKLGDKAYKWIEDRLEGKKEIETVDGDKFCFDMKGRIDASASAGRPDPRLLDEIYAAFGAGKITGNQAQDLADWFNTCGSRGLMTSENMNKWYRDLSGKKMENCPDWLIRAVWKKAKSTLNGKPIDEATIKALMGREMLSAIVSYGRLWNTKMPVGQAIDEGKTIEGMEIPAIEYPYVKEAAARNGIDVTDEEALEMFYAKYIAAGR